MAMTPAPTYTPPHLRGKLTNFSLGPSGATFLDVERSKGGMSEQAKTTISDDQQRATFDPEYREENFGKAIQDQYRGPQGTTDGMDRVRDKLTSLLSGAWKSSTATQGRSLATAGSLVGLLSATIGAARARGQGGSMLGNGLLWGMGGAALGTGATYLAQRSHNLREKNASAMGGIMMLLDQDRQLSESQRQAIIHALNRLSHTEKQEMSTLMRMGIGAGAGAIAIRYLKGKGLMPALIGGMLGALVGGSTGPSMNFNAFGRPT